MHGYLEERVEERTRALASSSAQLKEEIAEHKRTEVRLVAAKEAAEAAARIKSEFLANMSHEIRTPMNGVLGMPSLVIGSDLNKEQRDYLSVAKSSAESLLSAVASSESATATLPDHAPSLRVLIVEDNLINQKVVTRIVEKEGHIATVTANGLEALAAFTSSTFDVALMDVQMPLMDGLSATAAIRTIETEQGSSRLPIIGLTAHALPADFDRCMQAGMDGYLSKPFKANELTALMKQLTKHDAKRLKCWSATPVEK